MASLGTGVEYLGSIGQFGNSNPGFVFDQDNDMLYYDANGDAAGGQSLLCEFTVDILATDVVVV
ncbi:MAG: hypothetical protein D6E12_18325 [Desulfovibrio sp.]|nr:MAG: hypothetical protein D6E12_18325 [Desulfovibrio sp.]